MSETWEDVANAFVTHLEASSEIANAKNGYPREDLAEGHLTYAVLMPPTMGFQNVSMGSYRITYSLVVNVHVLKIADNQEWLLEDDINTCANKADAIFSYLKSNSMITVNSSRVKIMPSQAKVAKFTPSTQANRGKYAGVAINITLQV